MATTGGLSGSGARSVSSLRSGSPSQCDSSRSGSPRFARAVSSRVGQCSTQPGSTAQEREKSPGPETGAVSLDCQDKRLSRRAGHSSPTTKGNALPVASGAPRRSRVRAALQCLDVRPRLARSRNLPTTPVAGIGWRPFGPGMCCTWPGVLLSGALLGLRFLQRAGQCINL